MKVNGKYTNDPIQIDNTLNDFFTSIGPKLANKFQNSNSNQFKKFWGRVVYRVCICTKHQQMIFKI